VIQQSVNALVNIAYRRIKMPVNWRADNRNDSVGFPDAGWIERG
jgi:hypothetical protein